MRRSVRRIALLAPSACAACVLLPTLRGPPPAPDDGVPLAATGSHVDLRGIIHCHSWRSHDSDGHDLSIADAAREVGARFVVLTDHVRAGRPAGPAPDGPVHGVLFLPGLEARASGGGSLLAIGAREGIDVGGDERTVIASIRAAGGLAVLGHAEERRAWPPDVDAVELLNLHAETTDDCAVGIGLRALVLPPGALLDSLIEGRQQAAVVFDRVPRPRPPAAIGACDAHEAVRPLGRHAGAVDSYARVFRAATTHVLARDGSRAAILEALAAGRSYAACELHADATGFAFRIELDGRPVAGPGDLVERAAGLQLVVEAPGVAELLVVRDGDVIAEVTGASLSVPASQPGLYRVSATREGTPWVFTGGIRVRSGEAASGR